LGIVPREGTYTEREIRFREFEVGCPSCCGAWPTGRALGHAVA
jgi:hypothetical protein